MALKKVNVPISFAAGVDTGTDDKQLNAGSLTVLENGVFTTIRRISKRFGTQSLSNKNTDNVILDNPKSLSVFKSELTQYTNKRFYSYASSLDRWVDKGRIFNIIPTSRPVIRNAYQQSHPSVACSSDIRIYAWEDSRGGIRINIQDETNDVSFLRDEEVSATGTHPKVVALDNEFFIYYKSGSSIRYRTVEIFNPTAVSAETILKNNLDGTNPAFDVRTIGDKTFLAYHSTAANNLQITWVNPDKTTGTVASLAENSQNGVRISWDGIDTLAIAYANTTDVKVVAYKTNLTLQVLAPTSIETISNVLHVSINHISDDDFDIVYEIDAAADTNHLIRHNTVDLTGAIGTAKELHRSVGLASQLFNIDGTNYVAIVHASALQSTYFVSDMESNIVAKISPNLGGDLLSQHKLPYVCDETNNIIFPSQIKGRFISEDNTFFSLLGINSTTIDFDPETQYQDEVLGENLHISGGVLQLYDGENVVEQGFHLFPEDIVAGSTATTGGNLSDGTYLYTAVYAWTDNKGQLHRSPASIPISVTLSGGTATQTQEITVPTLRLTAKNNVVIELYRTEDVGSIFYKVTEVSSPNFNNKTVDTITITDTLSDADLLDNELLYTTGGVLENNPPPSSKFITSFNDRLVLAGLEEENLIVYSKIRTSKQPVEFNDNLFIKLESDGGRISAIRVMDDKLVIFKRSQIYFIAGDGPTNTGTLNNFTEPEKIATDVGCISANSVILTPQGLMFKSAKGIFLLTRDLQTIYIGKRVERFNNLNITSAKLVDDSNQVRFTTSTGDALVYDYLVNQWSTFTNYSAKDADVLGSTYYFLSSTGVVKKEVRDTYTDDGAAIVLDVEIGWLSFAGLQGFQRVYNMEVLGDVQSPHQMRVRVAYNYVNSFTQEVTLDSNDFTDFTPYGGYSPYGEPVDKVYGGVANRYQFDIKFKKQKCESIKIRLTEQQAGEIGQGLSLSAVTFLIGVKAGKFKVNSNRGFGTS